jgi:hypothetical protein
MATAGVQASPESASTKSRRFRRSLHSCWSHLREAVVQGLPGHGVDIVYKDKLSAWEPNQERSRVCESINKLEYKPRFVLRRSDNNQPLRKYERFLKVIFTILSQSLQRPEPQSGSDCIPTQSMGTMSPSYCRPYP